MRHVFSFLAAVFVAASLPLVGQADSVSNGLGGAQILPGWRKAPDLHIAALELDLQPGWKTYWRSPGAAGFAPQFDFGGSANVRSVRVIWPTPHAFFQDGVQTIGYKGRVVLPLEVRTEPGKDATLSGGLDLGICSTVCVPIRLDISQALPATGGKRSGQIIAALADQPTRPREAQVSGVECSVTPVNQGFDISARLTMPALPGREVTVIETGAPGAYVEQHDAERQGQTLMARATLYNEGSALAIDRSAIRITVIGDKGSVEIDGCPRG